MVDNQDVRSNKENNENNVNNVNTVEMKKRRPCVCKMDNDGIHHFYLGDSDDLYTGQAEMVRVAVNGHNRRKVMDFLRQRKDVTCKQQNNKLPAMSENEEDIEATIDFILVYKQVPDWLKEGGNGAPSVEQQRLAKEAYVAYANTKRKLKKEDNVHEPVDKKQKVKAVKATMEAGSSRSDVEAAEAVVEAGTSRSDVKAAMEIGSSRSDVEAAAEAVIVEAGTSRSDVKAASIADMEAGSSRSDVKAVAMVPAGSEAATLHLKELHKWSKKDMQYFVLAIRKYDNMWKEEHQIHQKKLKEILTELIESMLKILMAEEVNAEGNKSVRAIRAIHNDLFSLRVKIDDVETNKNVKDILQDILKGLRDCLNNFFQFPIFDVHEEDYIEFMIRLINGM